MNEKALSNSPTAPGRNPIVLEVRGMQHIPSYKNTKRGAHKGNGQTFVMTRKDTKQWMNRLIESFVSQLICATQRTGTDPTRTEVSQRSWIASFVPLDDSRKWIKEIRVTTEEVEEGEEGAIVTIAPLD
jgi:hypothetical protein